MSWRALCSNRAVMVAGAALLLSLLATACGGGYDDDDDDGDATTPPSATASAASSPAASASAPSQSGGVSDEAFRALEFPAELVDGKALGEPGAPVTLVVFEDFQCPFCLRFSLRDEPVIVEEYVFEGKVRLEFRNFPILGQDSVNAAIAAECAAAQDGFWPFHQQLFLAQYEAGQLEDEQLNVGRFGPEPLVAFAEAAGPDAVAFETCLFSDDPVTAVQADVREANDLGVRSTPSFLLDGEVIPNPSGPDEWREVLDEALSAP